MPLLRWCAMGRGRGQEEEEEEERQQRAVSSVAAVPVPVPRRGRWSGGEQQPQPAAAAGRAGWRFRSCAAAAIADCVALGCCPCAVVALAGLALVRAPLAVGRRLRRRRRLLLHRHRQRVRDVAASSAGKKARACDDKCAKAAGASSGAGGRTVLDTADGHDATVVSAATPGQHEQPQQQMQAEVVEEPAWLDEMYRAGQWGFGRVSFSGSIGGGGENPNPVTARCAGS